MFIHHVFFWLKEDQNAAHTAELVAGLTKLASATAIKTHHIGIPADTGRDVVEKSYAVSWLTIFDDQEAHDAYQIDPIHLQFISECSGLWSRVKVYDSVDA